MLYQVLNLQFRSNPCVTFFIILGTNKRLDTWPEKTTELSSEKIAIRLRVRTQALIETDESADMGCRWSESCNVADEVFASEHDLKFMM